VWHRWFWHGGADRAGSGTGGPGHTATLAGVAWMQRMGVAHAGPEVDHHVSHEVHCRCARNGCMQASNVSEGRLLGGMVQAMDRHK
jgi:hypothetical protein